MPPEPDDPVPLATEPRVPVPVAPPPEAPVVPEPDVLPPGLCGTSGRGLLRLPKIEGCHVEGDAHLPEDGRVGGRRGREPTRYLTWVAIVPAGSRPVVPTVRQGPPSREYASDTDVPGGNSATASILEMVLRTPGSPSQSLSEVMLPLSG